LAKGANIARVMYSHLRIIFAIHSALQVNNKAIKMLVGPKNEIHA